MSIRVSMIGLVSSTIVAALVVAGGCGGDKKTDPLAAEGGSSGEVGGGTSVGGTTATDAGGSTSGGSSAVGGSTISGYPTAGNGAFICRKGVPTGPAIAPGTNGTWGSAGPITGGSFAPYAGADADKLVPDTATTAGSVVLTATIAASGYSGYGLYFKDPDKCFNVASYSGVRMTIGGSSGGADVFLQLQMNDNYPIDATNSKGACVGTWSDGCKNAEFKIAADAIPATPTAIDVPWASIAAGTPVDLIDPSQLLGIQWQVNCVAADPCAVNLTIGEVSFY